jgi:hypothetical protein
VSRSLQRDLAFQAHIEGVELGQLMAEILAGGLQHRQHSARPVRRNPGNDSPGNEAPRRFDRQDRGAPDRRGESAGPWRSDRNNAARVQGLLEDRAGFMEYVRGLEQDGGHGNHAHGPGPSRGGRPGGFDNRGGGRRGPPPGGGGGGPRHDRPQRPAGGDQRGADRGPGNRGGDGQGGPSGSSSST